MIIDQTTPQELHRAEEYVISIKGKMVTITKTDGSRVKGTVHNTSSEEMHFRSGYFEVLLDTEKGIKRIPITDCRAISEVPEKEVKENSEEKL